MSVGWRGATTILESNGAFDLAATLASGQVFHWQPCGRGFAGTIGEVGVYAEQTGAVLSVSEEAAPLASQYFALDHPLGEIYASFPVDDAMTAAVTFCHGIRIVRQPLWECLATFITSSMKQVAHIAQMSRALRERFGEPVALGETTLRAYPLAERIGLADEAELRACGLGYRAPNLRATAALVASGEVNLEDLRKLDDDALRLALCRLPGVGVKVANCVMLFGYGRLRAFPIDVWIERILREIYFARKRKVTATRMRQFADGYFGPYGGYAQQYLFHRARTGARRR